MKTLFRLTLAALVFVSVGAIAGRTLPRPVDIDMEGRVASGDMVTARTSNNDIEFIGCQVLYFDDFVSGAFKFGFCEAADAEGQQIVCLTFNDELLQAIATMSDATHIRFQWNNSEDCIFIGTSNNSSYLPKNVKGN